MTIPANGRLSRPLSPVVSEPDGVSSIDAVSRGDRPVDRVDRWAHLGRVGIIAAQLALLAVVIQQFEIENAAFFQLALLTFGGFVIHAFLPMPYRLPFFALLSLGGNRVQVTIPGPAPNR